MTSIRELTQLQGLDVELTAARTQLEEIERELADAAALEELREQTEAQRQIAGELERTLRSAEWDVEQVRAHVAEEETKLYAGNVKSPKELMDLQKEVDSLKERQRQAEDAALEAMTSYETENTKTEEMARELASLEAERRQLEERLNADRDLLLATVAGLASRRDQISGRVPNKDLALYDNLLTMKGGRAVARIERAICQGCRTSLPMVIQQRVRSNQALVQCPSCGRILYGD